MIAALFVEEGGPYYRLPDVDPWGISRDARTYEGPWPVIAHPPCERWGRYAKGAPSRQVYQVGDDGGCAESAFQSVRHFGGVLEHPEASHAWSAFGVRKPPFKGGWIDAGDGIGATCCVCQRAYGHRARKATWLYAVLPYDPPELLWGNYPGERIDAGFHSNAERAAARAAGIPPVKRLSRAERIHTPIPFRDLLLSIVRPLQSTP